MQLMYEPVALPVKLLKGHACARMMCLMVQKHFVKGNKKAPPAAAVPC